MLITEKIGLWKQAYDAVRRDITPDEARAILNDMKKVEGVAQLRSYMELSAVVSANDRQAALVAAMLLSGIKRPVDYGEE